jgi:hydrogenase maturation protease
VLSLLASLAGDGELPVRRILVVGCEPADVGERIGLSEAVAAAVEPAAQTVREVVQDLRAGATREATPAMTAGGTTVGEPVRRR